MQKNTKNIGKIGEILVSNQLEKKGYSILDRNYLKKWGEIDIIAQKGQNIHFFEVKTVSRESLDASFDDYLPEENVHPEKLKRMYRTIQSYLMENFASEDVLWQIDVAGVFLDVSGKRAKIRITENVVI